MGQTETEKGGRRQDQRLKAYLVLQILMRETDSENVLSGESIGRKLSGWGINGESHSIYKDIKAINKASWLLRHPDKTIEDAAEAMERDKYGKERIILYDESKKGFYYQPKGYSAEEIHLLVESVYTAKFLTQKNTDDLTAFLCGFVSKRKAAEIRHDVLLTDRVRTNNKKVLENIHTINIAMENKPKEGITPQKIEFKYLKYNLNGEQVERRKGEPFIVSPYKLLINEGNYYLLAYVDKTQRIQTFRIDKMDSVRLKGEPREGKEAFAAINLKDYTKRTFSMYEGKQRRVTILFINSLLDAVYERFGKEGATYINIDAHHFKLIAEVKTTPQFFGWLLGFGTGAKLLGDEETLQRFTAYLDSIHKVYHPSAASKPK